MGPNALFFFYRCPAPGLYFVHLAKLYRDRACSQQNLYHGPPSPRAFAKASDLKGLRRAKTAKIAPWWLAAGTTLWLKYQDSYRRTSPPTFTPSTAGPLAGILNAAQKKSTFNLDNLIEVYTFVVY